MFHKKTLLFTVMKLINFCVYFIFLFLWINNVKYEHIMNYMKIDTYMRRFLFYLCNWFLYYLGQFLYIDIYLGKLYDFSFYEVDKN
ncbi:hypothetical protein PFAG_01527 [Plasmodium falciparum Santa Lucia]|uniref:Uncharacterized protein n=3 Tax=Plasmodium falciparum TaxID=5833 RepID=A0A024XAR1_PLAFC|nr:hypothetical protein PFMC_01574 [Plasmodium falciparum CAMP/Malaysia]EUR74738.1 hypothetical protein PFBG_01570 [Plasmodium falciparum 7G8]EUT89374.1 hypothetical protein PFAG_01527 [Plasmodium falciparum Santa Lucia]